MRCFALFCFFQLQLSPLWNLSCSFLFQDLRVTIRCSCSLYPTIFFIFRRFIRYIANFFFNVKLHRIGTLHFLCLSIGANQKALSLKGICVKATCLSNAEINQSLKRQKRGISICKSHNGSGYAISLAPFVPFRWLKRNLNLIFRLAKCSV